MSLLLCPQSLSFLKLSLVAFVLLPAALSRAESPLPVSLRLTNEAAVDQDDLCFWIHPQDPDASCIVVSDKSANKVFVYDSAGNTLQTIDVPQPGNIDLRDGFEFGDRTGSIVVVNERETERLAVFLMNPDSRQLEKIDDGQINTGENYGGTLLVDPNSRDLSFFVTSKEHGVTQFRLKVGEENKVVGERVRHWDLGMCEGAVGDDQNGDVYVSVETDGIYRLPGRTDDLREPERVIAVGQNGFLGDAEGITLIRAEDQEPRLIISDQGASRFRVHAIATGFPLRTSFAIESVQRTDGVDITLHSLGKRFPHGALACHSDQDQGRTVRVVDAREVMKRLSQ
jgi:3-phytase